MSKYFIETPNQGLFLSTQPFLNGNVHLSTGAWVLLRGRADAKYLKALELCQLKPGLYKRNPTSLDEHGPDDLFGLPLYSRNIAELVWAYLKHRAFFYQNDGGKWRIKSWMGRFPALLGHIQYQATGEMSWLFRMAWCLAVRSSRDKPVTNQDGWIQTMLLVEAYKSAGSKSYSDMDSACEIYEIYKPKISDIYAAYIGDNEHPLVQACKQRNI